MATVRRFIQTFTQIVKQQREVGGDHDSWQTVSTNPPISEQVNAWVEEAEVAIVDVGCAMQTIREAASADGVETRMFVKEYIITYMDPNDFVALEAALRQLKLPVAELTSEDDPLVEFAGGQDG